VSERAGKEQRTEGTDFVRAIVREDLASGKHAIPVTRFPPEPNGYLHIGHAKSICLNFGIALENEGGVCHLRFDDTNPESEDLEYVEAIQRDVRWLGFDWGENLFFASDYYGRLYAYAEELIRAGKAYVCSLDEDEIRAYRGTVKEPGRPSPFRDRTPEESLDLFRRMRAGEFPGGAHVLRAKIDMAADNMKLRDPLLYRIRHQAHYRTGDAWCIYPMYDFAHCLSDAIEQITHSVCTMEFENNRALYDWILDQLDVPCHPQQIEFARLNLTYTVLSKRKLLELVRDGHVAGWDDPRMPTLAGLRRRGVPPGAIRRFCRQVGVAKANALTEVQLFEHVLRQELNHEAPRVLGVLRPLRVVIESWKEGVVDWLDASYWPRDVPKEGVRKLPFSRVLYIERDDFREDPPKRFHRLAPGREVRLRYAYFIRCEEVVKDPETGEVTELRCSHDPATRGGSSPDGRKVKGTIHWVSAAHAVPAEMRLYDRLLNVEQPDAVEGDLEAALNPGSLEVIEAAWVEPSLKGAGPGERFQLERLGYFFTDPVDTGPDRLVLNRTVPLRDTWAKIEEKKEKKEKKSRGKRKGRGKGEGRSEAEAPGPVRELEAPTEALTARLRRYVTELGVSVADAQLLTRDEELADFFESGLREGHPRELAGLVVNEVLRVRKEMALSALPFGGAALGVLARLQATGKISGQSAKAVLEAMVAGGGEPEAIVAREGLEILGDADAIGALVDEVLAAHPAQRAQYAAGNQNLFGFFMGQLMRRTKGRADAKLARSVLQERLGRAGA